jgi:ABC-2 type transport system permease protein
MKKFVAVVKREYIQRVRSKMFLGVTLLGPLAISLFGVVPMLIFQIKAGGPVRVAVVDETGKMYSTFVRAAREDKSDAPEQQKAGSFNARPEDRMRPAQSDENFEFEEVQLAGRSTADVKSELNQKLQEKSLDGYLVLPANLFEEGVAEYYGSNTGDLFTREHLEDALSQSVREQRLSAANIDVEIVKSLSRPVSLQAVKVGAGEETSDSGEGFALVFATGFITYLTILMYGQIVLGAVIEEKETRIAEILFSSVKPMTLMLGKLIGVSFVALTQLAI